MPSTRSKISTINKINIRLTYIINNSIKKLEFENEVKIHTWDIQELEDKTSKRNVQLLKSALQTSVVKDLICLAFSALSKSVMGSVNTRRIYVAICDSHSVKLLCIIIFMS